MKGKKIDGLTGIVTNAHNKQLQFTFGAYHWTESLNSNTVYKFTAVHYFCTISKLSDNIDTLKSLSILPGGNKKKNYK